MIVQSLPQAGPVVLTAESDGLPPAQVEMTFAPPQGKKSIEL